VSEGCRQAVMPRALQRADAALMRSNADADTPRAQRRMPRNKR
jgi:hypothetical protein